MTFIAADSYGLARIGTSWWVTEGSGGATVTEYDAAGNVVSSFEAPEVAGAGPRIGGITTDGTDIFVTGYNSRVAQYDTSGTLLAQGPDDPDALGVSGGAFTMVAHDGGSTIWVGDNNADGQAVGAFDAATLAYVGPQFAVSDGVREGMYHDGKLWIVGNDNVIRSFDTAGTLLGTHGGCSQFPNMDGLWIEPDGERWFAQDELGFGNVCNAGWLLGAVAF